MAHWKDENKREKRPGLDHYFKKDREPKSWFVKAYQSPWPKISAAYKTGLWVKIIQFYLQSSFCNNLIWFFGHLIKANFWWLEYFLNPFSNTICTFINPSLSCEFYIWEVTDFCFIFVAFNSISIDQIIDESFLER